MIIGIFIFYFITEKFNDTKGFSNFLTAITNFILLLTLFIFIVQLSSSKILNKTRYIQYFNTNFIQNEAILGVLKNVIKSKYNDYSLSDYEKQLYCDNVIQYICYFEPLYYLLKDGIIEEDEMRNLIIHRFSIVACNTYIQDNVMKKYMAAFKNIFKLYKRLNGNDNEGHLIKYVNNLGLNSIKFDDLSKKHDNWIKEINNKKDSNTKKCKLFRLFSRDR